MNLNYFILFGIILLLSINSQNVLAANSIDWTASGGIIPSQPPGFFPVVLEKAGNIVNSLPISVLVDASDEGDFTSNGIIDTIDVLITSTEDPTGVPYTLTETGPNDGIFTGTSFVFLEGNYKFQITDIVNLVFTDHPSSGCGTDNTITFLDSRSGGPGNGFVIKSETDLTGIGIVLTETGENTCTFDGEIKFTTTPSDEITATLQVSQGDLLAFVNQKAFEITNAQIVPTVNGKGSIIVNSDDPDDQDTAEVTASYKGLSSGLDINDGTIGSGGGGPAFNPGLVLNFIRGLIGGGGNASAPPTLGIDDNQRRIVEKGFSFNENPVDVDLFYTPYPIITTEVGKLNTIKLKIYEDKGPDNITHVGLSYGLGSGEIFNKGKATIEYDKTFDGIESVTLFDPENVLGDVNVTTARVDCRTENDSQCLEVTFDHIFRESLEFNMVATNIWDYQRHGWQNYFNHGIQIVGDSMNPPDVYSGIYNGHIYNLTETGKNTAVDNEGNNWTFDKIWKRDYIKPKIYESDILNQEKIDAIKKLGFDFSDGQEIFGYARVDQKFSENKNQQMIEAKKIMSNLCPDCQKESFGEIKDIFSHDMPTRYSKLDDPENVIQMIQENKKAQEFLKQYFEKIYPGMVFD